MARFPKTISNSVRNQITMSTRYHIHITEELDELDHPNDLLSIRVEENPTKTIMKLLSAEKRGPRKGSKKPEVKP